MLSPGEVREHARALRGAEPETVLTWVVGAFPGKAALTVSFGGGGVGVRHPLDDGAARVPRDRRAADPESVPTRALEPGRRVALHPRERHSLPPAPRSGLHEHRVLAVHPAHRPGRA